MSKERQSDVNQNKNRDAHKMTPIRNCSEEFISCRLFVGGLKDAINDSQLVNYFKQYGQVVDTAVLQGFAFVQMSKPEEAKAAAESAGTAIIDGNRVRIHMAEKEKMNRKTDTFIGEDVKQIAEDLEVAIISTHRILKNYTQEIYEILSSMDVNCHYFKTFNGKSTQMHIRLFKDLKVPYIIILYQSSEENRTVVVKDVLSRTDYNSMPVDKAANMISSFFETKRLKDESNCYYYDFDQLEPDENTLRCFKMMVAGRALTVEQLESIIYYTKARLRNLRGPDYEQFQHPKLTIPNNQHSGRSLGNFNPPEKPNVHDLLNLLKTSAFNGPHTSEGDISEFAKSAPSLQEDVFSCKRQDYGNSRDTRTRKRYSEYEEYSEDRKRRREPEYRHETTDQDGREYYRNHENSQSRTKQDYRRDQY